MSTKKIRAALEARLKDFVDSHNISVVWENKGATATTTHIRATLFPSPTQNPSLGAEHRRYRGLFRMVLMVTDLGNHTQATETLGEALVDWFPRGSSIVYDNTIVNIEVTPSMSGIMYEGNFVYVVIELTYRSDTY